MYTREKAQLIWREALEVLRDEFSKIVFDTWIKTLSPIDIQDNYLILQTENKYLKQTLERRYLNTIINTIQLVSTFDMQVKIVLDENSDLNDFTSEFFSQSNLNPKYVFETFVRGKSNELAYAAALSIAEKPEDTTYNPLFLYGGVGLGKTHLMHSIGNFIINKYPNARVLYVSTENFTNELINSILYKKNQEFREKYRDIDILLMDDIQFLYNKEGTQEEFFHTFNTLYSANKQIVISSDKPPKEIQNLEERLISRFECGLIVDITVPDFETRCAIIEKKAELEYIKMPREVKEFIAHHFVSNIRNLEGALNKVVAYSKLTKTPIDINLAEYALHDLINSEPKKNITIQDIQRVVCEYFKISYDDLISKKRDKNIAYPRQIAMYLARKLLNISLPKIGEQFGQRDHSTVIHACDKIFREIDLNEELRKILDELERLILR